MIWSPFTGYVRGLLAPHTGFVYLREHPHLWRYGVMPILLNALLGILLLPLALGVAVYLTIHTGEYLTEHLGRFGRIAVNVGYFLSAIGLSFASWVVLQGVLCSFFYERLAREVELLLGIPSDELKDIPWLTLLLDALRHGLWLVILNAGLFVLNCLPVVGTILGLPVGYYINGMIFGEECFSYPLGLRGQDRQRRRAFTGQHRFVTLGLGTSVLIFSMIPLVGSIPVTTSVIGAVLLHRRLTESAP